MTDTTRSESENMKNNMAMDRHVRSWEYIGRAEVTTIDGVSGVLIQLSATS